jgi:hypothetical protein
MSSDTSVPLLRDLVGRVCRAVCHVPERAEELTTVIADGVEQAAGPGCELRFEARGGTLAVTVWMGSECTWRATRSVS